MLFPCQAVAKEISQRLNLLADQIRTQTRAGYLDDNHDLEGLMARFFNALFGSDLVNLNVIHPNYPAADLGDYERRLAFQITNTSAAAKITTTAEKAAKHRLNRHFDTLILFFLLPEKPEAPKKFTQPENGPHIKIWDLSDLLTLLADGPELAALQAANKILDLRLGPAGRSTPALSDPAALPKRATKFIGRRNELDILLPRFTENPRLAITGDGGLGKTALSAALLDAYRATPAGQRKTAHCLYAHNFYQLPSLEAFLSGILAHAGLKSKDPASDRVQVSRLLHQPGILLYIEGAEQLPALEPLLDLIGPDTALLLTTRHQVALDQLPSLPIGPLAEPDAIELLHFHAANYPRRLDHHPWPHGLEDPGWCLLARDLGRHPLACRLAGTHCGKHHKSPAAFHRQLKTQGLAVLSHGDSSKENLNRLWRSAAQALIAELPGEPSPAITAWHCLTLGGTNLTPFSVLQALGAGARDEHALTILIDHGLAESSEVPAATDGETEPGYNLTHALLGEWAKEGLTEFHRPTSTAISLSMKWGEALLAQVVHQHRVPGGEPRYRILVPLAESLLDAVLSNGSSLLPDQLYRFYYLPALMHRLHGRFSASESPLRAGLKAMEHHPNSPEPAISGALSNLAVLLQSTNRMTEAEPVLLRALSIDENYFGLNHPNVAIDLNNLAQLLKATNRLAEAEPLMRRALLIDEATFGLDHSNVAIDLIHLGQLLKVTNRLAEAEPLMRRALLIDETRFGSIHPAVARDLSTLAQLLQATNRTAEAEPLMRRALCISEACLGADHPEVARDLNNLAGLLHETGRIEEAQPLMIRALLIDETSFGPNHPKVAVRLNNLALMLKANRRLADAEPLMRRALLIDETSFGSHHFEVAIDLTNLADLLSANNRMAEAERMVRRALSIDEANFGSDHPMVATHLNNLAQLLQKTERMEEAEPLMRRMVVIFLKFTLRTEYEHPHLRTALRNYAGICMKRECSVGDFWRRMIGIGQEVGMLPERIDGLLREVFRKGIQEG